MTGTLGTCTSPCDEEPGANDDGTKMKRDEAIKSDEVT
jgi:hypothetical protein